MLMKKASHWQKKYESEVELKQHAMKMLGDLQNELKVIEKGGKPKEEDDSFDWKTKCKELFDMCKNLADENTELLKKVKGLQKGTESKTSISESVKEKEY